MLILKNIKKEYKDGSKRKKAINGISIEFKGNEFVAIVGSEGSGKTSILNIIAGLDRYTSGYLSIYGKSAREFSERDWDNYRAKSVGYVFQNYNLIPDQTALTNVELAMTLSGVTKSGRRERAIAVLQKVGLGDSIHRKASQMTRSQMQCASIARALVNDPDILLADEPTGAVDDQASSQIMKILKDISSDRLVIMTTANPELARLHSTRVVMLAEGKITDDSRPYHVAVRMPVKHRPGKNRRARKSSMRFPDAVSLGLHQTAASWRRTLTVCAFETAGIAAIGLSLSFSNNVAVILSISAFFAVLALLRRSSDCEKTHEIRIVRSLGGSRRDVLHINNTETMIIGLASGAAGTLLAWFSLFLIHIMNRKADAQAAELGLTVTEVAVLIFGSLALNYLSGLVFYIITVKKPLIKETKSCQK